MDGGACLKSEIIAVGTELLLGQIVNTNAQFLSQKLSQQGIDVYFHSVVGDNRERLLFVLEQASKRSDIIILTGGLGPTQDDITKETVAHFLKAKSIIDQQGLQKIESFFQRRQIPMSPNNIKQAEVIEGSLVLPNDHGLAVGMIYKANGQMYILLPGPPFELNPMFENYAIPYIQEQQNSPVKLFSHVLRFCGIGESALVTELEDLLTNQSDPTIAPYAKPAEVTLRISTKAISEEAAMSKIDPVIAQIKSRVGEHLYGEGDHITLEEVVLHTLMRLDMTLACAESCTGGLISKKITEHPGVSRFYKGGVICYTNDVKEKILNVDSKLLQQHGAVSAEVAEQLAIGVRLALDSDWGISVTGVAGPESVEGKPVGLVYIGISNATNTEVIPLQLAGTRKGIQTSAAKNALFQLWRRINHIQ